MKRLTAFFILFLVLGRVWAAEPLPPLILISLDGFRWDYCELHPDESPTFRRLKREGVAARGLVPVFPSNTFPNHYTIVTGLYPARHGIVNNDFFDPALGEYFHFNQPTSAHDPRWWGGEPIWVTAIKQGQKAAASFWVGSEAPVNGVRPTFWKSYDYKIPFETRLDELIGWLKLSPAERPSIVTWYFEETNSAGHRFGPASPQVIAAVKLLDERLAAMLARFRAEGVEPNLVLVSDHGMTDTSYERVVVLEDHLDMKNIRVDSDGSAAALRPVDDNVEAVLAAFKHVAHVKAYRAEELPARFHFKDNPRIAPVWILPDEGWHVGTRANREKLRVRYPEKGYLAGDHGFDPALTTMRGIFIAHGPAFRRGVELPEVENIHIYNLLCAALKLKPAPNDGDDRLVKAALR
jgi:predicted AlkP superfamily pyrophosphatase or phosphodiesterase